MLLRLFWCFFKIGLFGFGGGMGIVALIQHDVVEKNKWITDTQFTDIVAISQMTPGPIGINAATYVGYTAMANNGQCRSKAVISSLVTSGALVLPSFILMIVVSIFFMRYKDNPAVKRVLELIRLTVSGLFIATILLLCNAQTFGELRTADGGFNPQVAISIAIAVVSLYAGYVKKVSPIAVVACAGTVGWICYGWLGI